MEKFLAPAKEVLANPQRKILSAKIMSKDSNSNCLQMCLTTVYQATVEQAENKNFFYDKCFLPSLYHPDLTVHEPIILTVVSSRPP